MAIAIYHPREGKVSTFPGKELDPRQLLNYLINTACHEVGHCSQALSPRYDNDAMPKGSPLHPKPAEPGTVMETDLPIERKAKERLFFSVEDAEALRQHLNED